ncbi:MAG: hypothetical protein MHM6MM_004815 [Cercozoa sp. M6MM]
MTSEQQSEHLRRVVEVLRGPRFRRSFSMLELTKISADELLKLLDDVLGELRGRPVEWRDLPEAERWLLIYNLGYRPPKREEVAENEDDMQSRLARGDFNAVLSVLAWLLLRDQQGTEELRMRAYLGEFLSAPPIPREFAMQDSVQKELRKLRDLQKQFREVHQAVEELRQTSIDLHDDSLKGDASSRDENVTPGELTVEVHQLQHEFAQLQQRLTQMREEAESGDVVDGTAFSRVLELTRSLRQQQERQQDLISSLQELQEQLSKAQRHAAEQHAFSDATAEALHSLLSDSQDMPGHDFVSLVENCTQMMKSRLQQNSEETQRLQQREHDIAQVLQQYTDGGRRALSVDDIVHAEQQVAALTAQVHEQQRRRDSRDAQDDEELGFYFQRARDVQKRRDEARAQLEKTLAESDSLRVSVETRRQRCDTFRVEVRGESVSPMTREEAQSYIQELSKKTAGYKEKKTQLNQLRQALLNQSEEKEQLATRLKNATVALDEIEKRCGVAGLHSIQMQLTEAAEEKQCLNADKQEHLEQLSQLAEQIDSELRTQKSKLAPLIASLKKKRGEFAAEYRAFTQERDEHADLADRIARERAQLNKQQDNLNEELSQLQSETEQLRKEIVEMTTRQQQVAHDVAVKNESDSALIDGKWRTYAERYEALSKQTELEVSDMRAERDVLMRSLKRNEQKKRGLEHWASVLSVKLTLAHRRLQAAREDRTGESGQIDIGNFTAFTPFDCLQGVAVHSQLRVLMTTLC